MRLIYLGKDRTGIISMLVLSVLGCSDEEIIADYVLSDSAYKDINDKKAMVASLQQVEYKTAHPHAI
jgi:protein tyrosine/serine phosphatase